MKDKAGETAPTGDTTLIIPSHSSKPFRLDIEFAAQTHIGKVRAKNEDHFLVARACKSLDVLTTSLPEGPPPQFREREGYILLVADGMGGRGGGELASAFVVREAIRHIMETAKWFFRLEDPDEEVRLRLLRESLDRADRVLREQAEEDPTLAGMGTTLTALSLIGDDAFIVHVGDSRVYLLRNGTLDQLTTDHTLVQEMVNKGILSQENAKKHHLRHVITNVIGGPPGVKGEIVSIHLLDGDRLLLCTDGLTEVVPDGEITKILARHPSPHQACSSLVEAALSHGGPDNVTVIVATCAIGGGQKLN